MPPDVLARFGNNPFALVHAASANGAWQAGRLARREARSAGDCRRRGADRSNRCSGNWPSIPARRTWPRWCNRRARRRVWPFPARPRPTQLIAGLFSCLPPECRPEFSFSTGLKFSPRRPFRIVALSDDPAERQWVAHYPNVAVLDLRGQRIAAGDAAGRLGPADRADLGRRPHRLPGRAGVETAIPSDAGRFAGLGTSIARGVGRRGAWRSREPRRRAVGGPVEQRPASPRRPSPVRQERRGRSADGLGRPRLRLRRRPISIPARRRFSKSWSCSTIWCTRPSADARTRWNSSGRSGPRLVAELGEPLLDESREQYLRYALSIWEECTDADGVRHPVRAIQALDVLCLLFGDAI